MFNITKSKRFFKFVLLLCLTLVNHIAAGALHDPTQPPGMGYKYDETLNPASMYNYRIDGIFIGKDKKMAIINGQRVSVGDKIFNINVIDIDKNSVRLKDENGEFVISMNNAVIKTIRKK